MIRSSESRWTGWKLLVITLLACSALSCGQAGKASASNANTDSAYMLADGPYAVEVVEEMVLHDAKRDKDLPVKISFPKTGANFPIIIFSHGAGGSGTNYFPLTRFWTTHGYVVIQPTHADSIRLRRGQGEDARMGDIREGSELNDPKAWENRARDISFIIDSLSEIERRAPELKGKMDARRIGVGGHSYGAYTSQLIGGATVQIPGAKEPQSYVDERARAIMLLSPQGRNAMGLTETSWSAMKRPMISMTGTYDRGISGGQSPEWRLDPFKFSPAGDKYQLFIEGANHMSFTGRLAEERPVTGFLARRSARLGSGADQKAIFDYVKTASIAFWDAYLKDEKRAKEYLRSDALAAYSKGAVNLSRK